MMEGIPFVGLSILLLLWLPSLYALKENCQRQILEDCSQKWLMLSDETFVFPTNMESMNKRCREIRTLEKCVKDYMSRCLDGETRNSMSVVIYGISRTNKGYCSGTKKKNAFISFGDCANASKKMLEKHMATLTRDFHSAKLAKDPKLRLPYACCSYYRFKLSIVSAMDKRCPKETLEVENLLDGYARDGLNLLCGDYTEDSDKCNSIMPKMPKWTKALTSKVFVLPLVDILNSL